MPTLLVRFRTTYAFFLILAFMGFGFFGAVYYAQHAAQFRPHAYSTAEILRTRLLVHRLRSAEYRNARLTSEVAELQLKASGLKPAVDWARSDTLLRFTGLVQQQGEGIRITLEDSAKPLLLGDNPNSGIIHNTDLVQVVNELRAAGASGVAINGQPVVGMTGINCAGPIITINGARVATPFKVDALGNPKRLRVSVDKPKSFINELRKYGIGISVAPQSVVVPSYTQTRLSI